AEQCHDAAHARAAATLGMWSFIDTEILCVGVVFAGYAFCRVEFPEAFKEGSRHTELLLGTVETADLLISSCLIAVAVMEVQLGGKRIATWLIGLSAALGLACLIMH